MIRSIAASMLFALLLPAAGLAQTTWYVDVNGAPPGTGTQLDPYTSLQNAIAQAATVAGDTLRVSPGTYAEQIDFLGKDLTVQSTAGAATTVLDGGAAGRVVTFQSGESAAAVLDGFTVRNGRVLPAGSGFGGGIGCFGSSPTLVNLVVRDNSAGNGGGVSFQASSATLSFSVIRDNALIACCAGRGGGIEASCDASPVVSDCTILSNDGSVDGGGVCGAGLYLRCTIAQNSAFYGGGVNGGGCNPELRECVIEVNSTSGAFEFGPAGGVFGPADLYDCIIRNNSAHLKGGGAYQATLYGCSVESNTSYTTGATSPEGGGTWSCTLFDTAVVGNTATGGSGPPAGRGGGVFGGTATRCLIEGNLASSSGAFSPATGGGAHSATLVECEVIGNEARDLTAANPSQGGGAYGCTSRRTIFEGNLARVGAGTFGGSLLHCDVAGNVASVSEGGVAQATSVKNSIVWDNAPIAITATGPVTYSDVEGGFAGTGNFDADPLWWNGGYELRPDSPCIDTGDPTSPLDPDGSIADVGARPYDPTFAPGTQGFCYGNGIDCPCGNGGSGDGGCDLPQTTGGVELAIESFAPNFAGGGSAHLVGTGFPAMSSPTVVVIRSPSAEVPPVVFGDGLRCIASSGLVRLGAQLANGGASDQTIGHGGGAGTFVYQLWFRSVPVTFCDPSAAFNLSNGLEIAWP